MKLYCDFRKSEELYVGFADGEAFEADFGEVTVVTDQSLIPVYSNDTDIIPMSFPQTVSTAGRFLNSNITVNAIPSNYGLITFDGYALTVS